MTLAPDMDNAPEQHATDATKPQPSLEEYQSLLQQANLLTQKLRDIEGQFGGGPRISGQNENDAAEPKGSADDVRPENGASSIVQKASEQKNNIEDRVALIEGQLTRLQFDDEKPNNLTRLGSELNRSQEEPLELTQLPESTYSLLITEPTFTKAYTFGIVTALLSMTCLAMTLIYSFDQGDDSNPWGLPVGVDKRVRGAQFLGLELIASGFAHNFSLDDGSTLIYKRVIFSSVLRLVIGYMFLLSLFINVVQNSDVISVFYDILALQFVESLDDVAYALGKRGFFGETIRKSTSIQHSLTAVGDRGLSSIQRVFGLARFAYFLNLVIMIAGLSAITVQSNAGAYGCSTLSVNFPELMWDEDGQLVNGYPRYVEMNKNSGEPYSETVPAEFVYCKDDVNSWVFRHPRIRTAPPGFPEKENECNWLMRSEETSEHDLLKVAKEEWMVWTDKITFDFEMDLSCNECWSMGMARESLGKMMRADSLVDESFLRVYNRPVYVKGGMSGVPTAFLGASAGKNMSDIFFEQESLLENYSLVVWFAGSRWLGALVRPNMKLTDKFSDEYHAFWSDALKFGHIFLVSATNTDGDPGTVPFFTMNNRDIRSQRLKITLDAGDLSSVWYVARQGGGMFGTLEPVMGDRDLGLFLCLRKEQTKLMQEHFNRSEFLDWSPSTSNPADKVKGNYTFLP
ncbi:hypothetical protein THAOC_02455 [Thalassiosira oceanica]|uniref:Uncharacterized protein n=1 Tax=Thalassiosira oceanica TaxID=159749 RepID=K0TEJ4_THAOC|nr:hypothetical protein THAOC_02455 [Thalassiosira oceanica]|eukprot:EJK75810.1 hypothetical protein THAOC_02455 [Thalassiosira oceanica]